MTDKNPYDHLDPRWQLFETGRSAHLLSGQYAADAERWQLKAQEQRTKFVAYEEALKALDPTFKGF